MLTQMLLADTLADSINEIGKELWYKEPTGHFKLRIVGDEKVLEEAIDDLLERFNNANMMYLLEYEYDNTIYEFTLTLLQPPGVDVECITEDASNRVIGVTISKEEVKEVKKVKPKRKPVQEEVSTKWECDDMMIQLNHGQALIHGRHDNTTDSEWKFFKSNLEVNSEEHYHKVYNYLMIRDGHVGKKDDPWQEVYEIVEGVDDLIGDHKPLQMFKSRLHSDDGYYKTTYYQIYDGGDQEFGVFVYRFHRSDGKCEFEQIYSVQRTEGQPFSAVPMLSKRMILKHENETTYIMFH